jgi:hypothetical protein
MTLGQSRLKRRPARVKDFPDDGPVPLQKAWIELSRIEFAAWCRLCAEDETMQFSKHQLAKILDMSKRRLNELMRTLSHKGYLALVPVEGQGQPMRVCITRKPALMGRTNFINVGSL